MNFIRGQKVRICPFVDIDKKRFIAVLGRYGEKQELNRYLTYVIVLNDPAINIISSKNRK